MKFRYLLSILCFVLTVSGALAQFKVDTLVPIAYTEISLISGGVGAGRQIDDHTFELPNYILQTADQSYLFLGKDLKIISDVDGIPTRGFNHGLAIARFGDQCGYVDFNARSVFEQRFDRCEDFDSGLALVKSDGQLLVIDTTGSTVYGGGQDTLVWYNEHYAVIKREGKLYSIDRKGALVESKGFDRIGMMDGVKYLVFARGDKYGLLSPEGKVVIKAKYDSLNNAASANQSGKQTATTTLYINGEEQHPRIAFYFERKGQKGFVNAKGEEVLLFEDYRTNESGGYFAFRKGKYALVGADGAVRSKFEYAHMYDLRPGFTLAVKDPSRTILDKEGKAICGEYLNVSKPLPEPNASWIKVGNGDRNGTENFIHLHSREMFFDQDNPGYKKLELITDSIVVANTASNKLYGLVDRNGTYVAPPKFYKIERFNHGAALAVKNDSIDGILHVTYGFLSLDGSFFSPEHHRDSVVGRVVHKNGKYVREGNDVVAINIGKMDSKPLKDGYSIYYPPVSGYNKEYKGLINRDLEVIVPRDRKYIEIKGPDDGTFMVKNELGKYGYVDLTGNEIIACQYDFANPFQLGLAQVGRKFVINQNGDTVLTIRSDNWSEPPPDELLGRFGDQWIVKRGAKKGFINDHGGFIGEVKYDDVTPFSNGLARVQMNGKWGLINDEGQMIWQAEYVHLEVLPSNSGLWVIAGKEAGENGLFEMNGTPILQPEYETIKKVYANYLSDQGEESWQMVLQISQGANYGLVRVRSGE